MENIQNVFINEYINYINKIFINKKVDNMSQTELIDEFRKLVIISDNNVVLTPKIKKTYNKKEISDEDRCMALKKDTTRCKSKKQANGANPILCILHNKNGTNYGFYIHKEDTVVNENKKIKTQNKVPIENLNKELESQLEEEFNQNSNEEFDEEFE